jgi:Ankyrin repeats (3 copies)
MSDDVSARTDGTKPEAASAFWRADPSLLLSMPAILLVLLRDAPSGLNCEYLFITIPMAPFWIPGIGGLLLAIPAFFLARHKVMKFVATVAVALAVMSLGRMFILNIPLKEAARHGQVEKAKTLLMLGAHAKVRDGWGYTPLHEAAGNNHPEMVRLLLDRGADVNAPSIPARNTPLIYAAAGYAGPEVVELLLDHGATTDRVGYHGSEGCTALQKAALNGRVDVVRTLLKRGISPNEKAGTHSALYHAQKQGHTDIAQILLDAGADPKGK